MLHIILSCLLITSITLFTIKRNLSYLHIFQQEEYDNYRFLKWIICHKAVDKRLTGILCLIFIINYFAFIYINTTWNYILEFTAEYLAFILAIFLFVYLENNPLKSAKKKLVMTNRANRIYYLSLFINLFFNLIFLINVRLDNYFIALILTIQLIPIYIILSNLLLTPIEKHIQQKFWQEAKQKMSTHNPFVIGITGSFGKTSVKHFLGHILQQTNHTLITAGSINTIMGISRTIREELNTAHKYFVVEMGAYGIGSINQMCQLTPPNLGIITAIGMAHYERFKTLDTVARAKLELAESVINNIKNNQHNKSKVIIPEQVLNTDYAKQYLQDHQQYFNVLKQQQISKVSQLKTGLNLDLQVDGVNYHIETPIFGLHNANNIGIAFLAAYNMGINIPTILTAFKTMPQIHHRLEVRSKDDCIIIDDSYNANPNGFKSALELLSFLHTPPGRRILVTPGLIELGNKHQSEHLMLGEYSAQHADIAVIVNPKRIESFISGFTKNPKKSVQLVKVCSFKDAINWLDINCQAKDTILFANDLPDLYESGLKI